MKFGLNLFSLNKLIQNEKDFTETMFKLKEMGYDYMQFSGAPFDAKLIKKVSEETNLPVYLTHVPLDRIISDTEKLMEEHSLFGCKNIGLGMIPGKISANDKEFKTHVEKLNLSAEKMHKNGFKFFYHHHHIEFFKNSKGEKLIDYMVENAPFINFTLDTYWLQVGGVDILSYIEKLKGRIECVHLKDYQIKCKAVDDGVEFEPAFAPVGDGNLDFKTIMKKMKDAGVKYYFVEQDDACSYENPLEQVERSIKYLKKEF